MKTRRLQQGHLVNHRSWYNDLHQNSA